MKRWILGLVLAIGLVACSDQKVPKTGYVDNIKLFGDFTGKKELEQKLNAEKSSLDRGLDSLRLQLGALQQTVPNSEQFQLAKMNYERSMMEAQTAYQQADAQYTEQIWTQINTYIQDYGKENGYDYIFGTTGGGNLMYGSEGYDLTELITQYINDKYAGK